MHELGVVFHIIKQVDKVAKDNNAHIVKSVTLQIGEVSMIVPHYFEDCWKWAVDNRSEYMHGCKLIIETIPAVTFCQDCENEYETIKFGKICPFCNSNNTYLKQGNELIIKEIEVE